MINHCDRHITLLSDIYYSDLSCYVSDCTVSVSLKKSDTSITVIYAMSLSTASVSLRRVICLSQWFITLYLRLYCISITKKSDTSITVITHAMSDYCISIIKKSNTSITMIYHAMSDCTVSVSLRRVICLSQLFITLCLCMRDKSLW
jgi:hypothetical protein